MVKGLLSTTIGTHNMCFFTTKALNVPEKKDLYPDPILSENLELDPDQFLSVEKGSISRSYPRFDPF